MLFSSLCISQRLIWKSNSASHVITWTTFNLFKLLCNISAALPMPVTSRTKSKQHSAPQSQYCTIAKDYLVSKILHLIALTWADYISKDTKMKGFIIHKGGQQSYFGPSLSLVCICLSLTFLLAFVDEVPYIWVLLIFQGWLCSWYLWYSHVEQRDFIYIYI